MSNEEKMRQEFMLKFGMRTAVPSPEEAYTEGVKACAAIKDAEIAELKALNITTHEKELIACDLMIKELREAISNAVSVLNRMEVSVPTSLTKALDNSEHHNSRALEKKLLEARIESLNCVNRDAALFEYKLQLAELNKE